MDIRNEIEKLRLPITDRVESIGFEKCKRAILNILDRHNDNIELELLDECDVFDSIDIEE